MAQIAKCLHLGASKVASECMPGLKRLLGLSAGTLGKMPTLGCQPGGAECISG